jgi:predicted phage gp36 major capsid-like protein
MARKRTIRRGSRRLNATAESLGAALGHVAARFDAWKQQRVEIAADVRKLLRSAEAMLDDLGDAASGRASELLNGVSRNKGGRPKGYKMSEATKRKLRAAWKRRKAARAGKAATKP